MKPDLFCLLCFSWFVLATCNRPEPVPSAEEIRQTQDALVGANRIMVRKDREKIRAYAERHNLQLTEMNSGLWFGLVGKGTGDPALPGRLAVLKFKVSLLDGTVCYSSDSGGLKTFLIGQGGVESGLEEGILRMRAGDQAVLIMPPHLAHGLTGDGDKIPARAVVVYEVQLLEVKKPD